MSSNTFVILCKNGQVFTGEFHIFARWEYIQNLINFAGLEERTRTIDFSQYLTYCAVKLIYLCLDESPIFEAYVEWAQPSDAEDLNLHKSELLLEGTQFGRLLKMLQKPNEWSSAQFWILDAIDHAFGKVPCDIGDLHKRQDAVSALLHISKEELFVQYLRHDLIPEGTLSFFESAMRRRGFDNANGCLPNSDDLCDFILHQEFEYGDWGRSNLSATRTMTLEKYLLSVGHMRALKLYLFLNNPVSPMNFVANELEGFTSMHILAAKGDLPLLYWFYEQSKLDGKNLCVLSDMKRGILPIHIAAWMNDASMLSFLVPETGIVVGLLSKFVCQMKCTLYGMTVAHYAAMGLVRESSQHLGVSSFEWLLQNDCVDLDAKDFKGRTVMDIALENDCIELVEIITRRLESGASKSNPIHDSSIMDDFEFQYESDFDDAYDDQEATDDE